MEHMPVYNEGLSLENQQIPMANQDSLSTGMFVMCKNYFLLDKSLSGLFIIMIPWMTMLLKILLFYELLE